MNVNETRDVPTNTHRGRTRMVLGKVLQKKTNQELNQHSHFCRFISHYSKSKQGYHGVLKKNKIHRNTLVPQKEAETTVFKLAINSALQKENPRPDVTASKTAAKPHYFLMQ